MIHGRHSSEFASGCDVRSGGCCRDRENWFCNQCASCLCVCWVEEESLCQKVRGTKREEAPAKVVVSINNAVDSTEVKRKAGDAFSFLGLERTGGGLGQVPGWLGDQVSDS